MSISSRRNVTGMWSSELRETLLRCGDWGSVTVGGADEFPSERLRTLTRPAVCVMNSAMRRERGEHWTCAILWDSVCATGEFFDPLGRPMSDYLFFTDMREFIASPFEMESLALQAVGNTRCGNAVIAYACGRASGVSRKAMVRTLQRMMVGCSSFAR